MTTVATSPLRGRADEQRVLDDLLRDVHDGKSEPLIMRGKAYA